MPIGSIWGKLWITQIIPIRFSVWSMVFMVMGRILLGQNISIRYFNNLLNLIRAGLKLRNFRFCGGTTQLVRPLCHLLIFNIWPTPAVRAQARLQRVTNNTQFFEYIENFNIYRLYHFLFKYTENEIKVQSDSKPQIEANLNCHS